MLKEKVSPCHSLFEWETAAGVCCCGDAVKVRDRACTLESTLGCECCCFTWDAEQLPDMKALCPVCGLELEPQLERKDGGPIS